MLSSSKADPITWGSFVCSRSHERARYKYTRLSSSSENRREKTVLDVEDAVEQVTKEVGLECSYPYVASGLVARAFVTGFKVYPPYATMTAVPMRCLLVPDMHHTAPPDVTPMLPNVSTEVSSASFTPSLSIATASTKRELDAIYWMIYTELARQHTLRDAFCYITILSDIRASCSGFTLSS